MTKKKLFHHHFFGGEGRFDRHLALTGKERALRISFVTKFCNHYNNKKINKDPKARKSKKKKLETSAMFRNIQILLLFHILFPNHHWWWRRWQRHHNLLQSINKK